MYVAVRHVGHRAVLGRGWAGGGCDLREGETGARENTTAEAKKTSLWMALSSTLVNTY